MTIQEFQQHLENGEFVFPGGLPTFFITADGGILSHDACLEMKETIVDAMIDSGNNKQWEVIGIEVNYEDGTLVCDHTGKPIPCAYCEF
jgi:hypothetical protein